VRDAHEPALLTGVTCDGQDSDRARAKAAGFDHHVVKPISFDVLSSLLEGRPGAAP
jgi:CheY-like chemotaxis protein